MKPAGTGNPGAAPPPATGCWAILNPASAGGRTGRRAPALQRRLEAALGPCRLCRTEGPGHAGELAATAAAAGARTLICIGGDGTLSELVDGLFRTGESLPPELRVGLLASGTGSDFRRGLGLPAQLEGQLEVLRAGRIRRIDVGRARFFSHAGAETVRHFLNSLSFGMSGEVCAAVNRAGAAKRLGGRPAFYLASLKTLLGYRNRPVRLGVDGNAPEEFLANTIALCNGGWVGGGMRMAPAAQLDDGMLDLVTIGDLGLVDFLLQMPRLYRGTHLSHGKVGWRQVASVAVESTGPVGLEIELDGENVGRTPAAVTLLPAALPFLAAAPSP